MSTLTRKRQARLSPVSAHGEPRWTHIRRAALWCLAGSALTGCGTLNPDGSAAVAQVRFVELSPGAPAMDFYLNGTAAAYSVGYANYTSYLPVASGPLAISANRVGSGQTLTTVQGTVAGGHQYTAVVSHGLGSLQAHLYEDQEGPAAAGQVAVRVLDEIDGPGALTVYVAPAEGSATVSAAPVLMNLMSGGASAYLTLPAGGSYTVSATIGETGLRVPVNTVALKASSGAVRTIVFGGTAGHGSHSALGFALDDADAF